MKLLSLLLNLILDPSLDYLGSKTRVTFNARWLNHDKITYAHNSIVNIYIVYEISKNVNINSYCTLENCLFGAIKLRKIPDIDWCKYSGYGIGFDRKGKFSVINEFGRNCTIFGVDMSSSIHVDNKKKHILILGKGPTQELGGTPSPAEKMYSINFTESNYKFCLGLHYNEANSYFF